MEKPVFYDHSGRRDRWTMRGFFALVLAIVLAAGAFAMTVISVPVPTPLKLAMERPLPRPLKQQVNHLGRRAAKSIAAIRHGFASWLPAPHLQQAGPADPIDVGFYVPWDDASRASLAKHIDQLDWIIPSFYFVTGPNHQLRRQPDPRFDALIAGAVHRPKILPMVQNALNDTWDTDSAVRLLHDPAQRHAFLISLQQQIDQRRADGVTFDFESLPAGAQRDYLSLLAEAHALFGQHKQLVIATVPVDNPDWKLKDYAAVTDKLVLMTYDEHTPDGEIGPIASQGWFVRELNHALAEIPADKAIVGIGNYAYDWSASGHGASLSIEEAWLSAHDSEAPIQFDRVSGNATFSYEDGGQTHTVWMLDAASAWNELSAAQIRGVAGFALWRLGSEDSGFWKALAARDAKQFPDLRALDTVGNVDVEGNGEILSIASVPTPGSRAITRTPQGLIVDEHYAQLPTPYVVRRTGYRPGLVALKIGRASWRERG